MIDCVIVPNMKAKRIVFGIDNERPWFRELGDETLAVDIKWTGGLMIYLVLEGSSTHVTEAQLVATSEALVIHLEGDGRIFAGL